MKILLDYLFPITAIEPTPAASTAFLKQVCVVAKPKDGGVTTGVITLCTSQSAVDALVGSDASDEIAELFSGGLNRVYVLPMDDLDLADALDGASDFYTLLLTSEWTDEEIAEDVDTPAVKASRIIGDVKFEAVDAGTAGNSITIILDDSRTDGGANAHATGTVVTVYIEAGTTTANTIIDAVTESVSSSALVVATLDGDNVAQSAQTSLALQNGAAATYTEGTGMDIGTFKGVTGVSSDDDDVLEAQAAKENRCAFHIDSDNGALNMFYAFGKLLSNSLNWRNQQYISMPYADDVDTLGDANNLFDLRISFVISDDEFSSRLGFFGCGGKAITAPYIEKNLQIDMQSAALSYIASNQPAYTKTQAALIEDELQKVIDQFISVDWLEAGTVEVELLEDNFVAAGSINISEPKALWRIFGEMRQTL